MGFKPRIVGTVVFSEHYPNQRAHIRPTDTVEQCIDKYTSAFPQDAELYLKYLRAHELVNEDGSSKSGEIKFKIGIPKLMMECIGAFHKDFMQDPDKLASLSAYCPKLTPKRMGR